MIEAMFYKKLNDDMVQCDLCPNYCVIHDFEKGTCGVRENRHGKLYSNVYGKLIALAVDPIEKKPLFHFYPNSKALSIATVGCNLRCTFCQNYEISQTFGEIKGETFTPQQVVDICLEKNLKIIAYTYTEPTIAFEYYLEVMKLAKKNNIKNVFITNGYINPEPLRQIGKYIDAANIDLKSFSEEFYHKETGGHLKPVLEAIKLYYKLGIWIEITSLLIPGKNIDGMSKIADFIASIDKNIPWHISRFYPHFLMKDVTPTSPEILEEIYQIGGKAGLNYVYVGNIENEHQNTVCPECGEILIKRDNFSSVNFLSKNKCPKCGFKIAGIFK